MQINSRDEKPTWNVDSSLPWDDRDWWYYRGGSNVTPRCRDRAYQADGEGYRQGGSEVCKIFKILALIHLILAFKILFT